MKKIACLVLICACVLMGICGCDSLRTRPVTLADNISVPEDGAIDALVFETLKAENKAVSFIGKSGDILYKWIVFGSDIPDPKALDLRIEVTEAGGEKVAFRFLSEENFGFVPVLSVYLNEQWNAQSASVCSVLPDGTKKNFSAAVTGEEKSVITFSPEVQTGSCVIVPEPLPEEIPPEETSNEFSSPETEEPKVPETDETPNSSETPDKTPGFASSEEASSLESSGLSEQQAVAPENFSQPSVPDSVPEKTPDSSVDNSSTFEEILPSFFAPGTEQNQDPAAPAPEEKPSLPETADEQTDLRKTYTCTFSIECYTVLDHLDDLDPEKLDILPKNGVIFPSQTVVFYEGESVYDVLKRVCEENKIHLETSQTPIYNSAYIEGIGNLYEFDCGSGSGWMYRVGGQYCNYGCSGYRLKQGETVEWRYTCNFGKDIGGKQSIGE